MRANKNKYVIALTVVALLLGTSAYAASSNTDTTSYSEKDVIEDNLEQVPIDIDAVNISKVLDNVYEICIQEFGCNAEATTDEKIRELKKLGLLDDLGIFGSYDGDVQITRTMFLQFMTTVLKETGKTNVPDSYVCTYKDGNLYEDLAIEFVQYNNLMSNGTDWFDGYSVMNRTEAVELLTRFQEILKGAAVKDTTERTIEIDQAHENNILKEIYSDPTLGRDSKTQASINAAAKVLKNKTPVDNLYGHSKAAYKEPKTIQELDKNLEQLVVGNPYRSNNNYNFINIDEGLYNYSLIAPYELIDVSSDEQQQFMEESKVTAIAACEMPKGVAVIKEGNKVSLYHGRFGDMGTNLIGYDMMMFRSDIYLISDNMVTERGMLYETSVYTDNDVILEFTADKLKTADYLGVVVSREYLDDTYEGTEQYVLMLLKIDDYIKNMA